MNSFPEHLDRNEREALLRLRERLSELLGSKLERMVLFGSKARGDYDEESDIDVVIIVNGLDRDLKRIIFDIVGDIELEKDVVIGSWVVSVEDFEMLRQRERRIALDVEKEGVPF